MNVWRHPIQTSKHTQLNHNKSLYRTDIKELKLQYTSQCSSVPKYQTMFSSLSEKVCIKFKERTINQRSMINSPNLHNLPQLDAILYKEALSSTFTQQERNLPNVYSYFKVESYRTCYIAVIYLMPDDDRPTLNKDDL